MPPRVTLAYIVAGDPDLDAASECPDCGFDALLTWPLYSLSENGVSEFGVYKACVRCYEEAT